MKTWKDIERATNAQILEWAEAQPWALEMAACQQDAQWHAEGDVWTHTRLVCAELERLADWPSLDRAAQLKLLFTALFHDAGKPATTALDTDTGRTRSPKHALVGAEIARRVLRELECDLITREEIYALGVVAVLAVSLLLFLKFGTRPKSTGSPATASDRKSTRLNSSHLKLSRMPSSA